MPTPPYIIPLEILFNEYADEDTAIQMKKYMKDRYEFFGIKSPVRKEIYKTFKAEQGMIPAADETEIVKWCWKAPQREYHYFAMEFLGKKAKKADEELLALYEYMITHKSWWDTVDYIASNLVGVYFQKYPSKIVPTTNMWMKSDNMWLQRTCLLFQLKFRLKTDHKLLTSFILPLIESNEFFIRKAIGWSLREYSKHNPAFVIDFVKNHSLSGLSEREALKWLKNK